MLLLVRQHKLLNVGRTDEKVGTKRRSSGSSKRNRDLQV